MESLMYPGDSRKRPFPPASAIAVHVDDDGYTDNTIISKKAREKHRCQKELKEEKTFRGKIKSVVKKFKPLIIASIFLTSFFCSLFFVLLSVIFLMCGILGKISVILIPTTISVTILIISYVIKEIHPRSIGINKFISTFFNLKD